MDASHGVFWTLTLLTVSGSTLWLRRSQERTIALLKVIIKRQKWADDDAADIAYDLEKVHQRAEGVMDDAEPGEAADAGMRRTNGSTTDDA